MSFWQQNKSKRSLLSLADPRRFDFLSTEGEAPIGECMILAQALAPALAKGPNNCAIEFLGKNTTYRDLMAAVARLSYLFQKEIGVGQRVAYLGSNSAAFIPAFFALTNNRSLTIPIDPALSDLELAEWVRDTHPTHVLVTSDTLNRVRDLFRRQNLSLPIIELEKKRAGEYDATFVAPPEHQPNEKDAILLLRTAGTAGRYKYVLFNHLQLQGPLIGLRKLYRFTNNERVLTSMSWSHPFAFVHGMLFPILNGAACIVDRGHRGEDFLKFIAEVRPTRLVDTPDFLQKLAIASGQFKTPLAGIKSATVGTSDLNANAQSLLERMKVKVLRCYGLTENLWTIAMSDFEARSNRMQGLVGYRYKVIDRSGDEVEGSSREGQLCVQAPAVMLRYVLPREEDVKQLMMETIRGTWLYTGDLFRLDDNSDGEPTLTFLGRKDGLYCASNLSRYS